MHKIRPILTCLVFVLLIDSILSFPVSSQDDVIPFWNDGWSFRKEIILPIPTKSSYAKFQPIDIRLDFEEKCWALNESENSIRICCWDGQMWKELESQIYQLNHTDNNYISNCRIVFLIPDSANGEERYFVYYNDYEKSSANYQDHVAIKDAYYYFEPVSGISVEGDYYSITEDGYIVYAVGQKGKVLYRGLSQTVIKMKPFSKKFEIANTDVLASFGFAYHKGANEDDEIASDKNLVSKEIIVDGNLMVEFGIVSESPNKEIRTTNVYKYYYSPEDNKRISVKVKHEIFEDLKVEGVTNVDGRYGAIISYKSNSVAIQRMNFGSILPYLHIYSEDDRIKEYKLISNPENKEREWLISYEDDCDLGDGAWISYDEGEFGRCFGIIFSSNKKIVEEGVSERDGLEIKIAEKEYLDVVGTEVDYASIAFGRNSFELGDIHDVNIPEGMVIEFDAEFYYAQNGSYHDVEQESMFFKELVKSRHINIEDSFVGVENIYTLSVIPHLSGRVISYPNLVRMFDLPLPFIWIEIYENSTLLSAGMVNKPFSGLQAKKFPKLSPGFYEVKIYRMRGNFSKNIIGVGSVELTMDTSLHVYCTWEKNVDISFKDQYGRFIENVEIIVRKNGFVVVENSTDKIGKLTLKVPFNLFDSYSIRGNNKTRFSMFNSPFIVSKPYYLEAIYKGFLIFDCNISAFQNKINFDLDLYDLELQVEDSQDLDPGVDVRPFLTSRSMHYYYEIAPRYIGKGKFLFEEIPSSVYDLHISFGDFVDTKKIDVPDDGLVSHIEFSANYNLLIELFNSRGERINGKNEKLDVIRSGRKIKEQISSDKILDLPPGEYSIYVYSEGNIIGTKTVDLTNDRTVKIVTIVNSIFPTIIIWISFLFVILIILLFIIKKISLNSLLKLLAISLIIASLFLPWWSLDASRDEFSLSKTSHMYVIPRVMIEKINFHDKIFLDLSTIPESFTDFLGILLFVIGAGVILMIFSFVPNIFLKRRYSFILITASFIFIFLVAGAFSFGMSKICEISLGSLEGEGILNINLPSGETFYLNANWGLGMGFYLCVQSASILVIAGVIDYLRSKNKLDFKF